jgi:hypothetical protein
MNLGHGFLPRVDARNFKAVERCLLRDGDGLFHEGLQLPWAVVEGPWALSGGQSALEMCRDRDVSVLIDTQAWRYHEPRTFAVEKFTTVRHAPAAPLSITDRDDMRTFIGADLELQAALGASAYLVPGVVPSSPKDEIAPEVLKILELAEGLVLDAPKPCIAFVGVHASRMAEAHQIVEALPAWIEGVYLQVTPVDPLRDSPAKLIDILALLDGLARRGLTVIGGRLAGLGPLARALGIDGVDAALGEGESFRYGAKVANHEQRKGASRPPRLPGGRLYVPQLGRSFSRVEWERLMAVPSVRGQLMCRLPCCAFGQPLETTPARGREHSLHTRVAEARSLVGLGTRPALLKTIGLLEAQQSLGRTVADAFRAADLDPLSFEHVENQLGAARFFVDAAEEAA